MKRSELYERVWSTPATKIAEELGISGSRVAAICKRHGIPTPPRGYWAKLGVGKHVPKTALPQPEADYELKLGGPPPTASPWVAPGVLLRPDAIDEPPPLTRRVASDLMPAAAWPFPPAAPNSPPPENSATPASAIEVDLNLVRAAAAELEAVRSIESLLQAVAVRAMQAAPHEAQRLVNWATAVRAQLDDRDPVAALMRLAV